MQKSEDFLGTIKGAGSLHAAWRVLGEVNTAAAAAPRLLATRPPRLSQ